MSIMDKIILVALLSLFSVVTAQDTENVMDNYFMGCIKLKSNAVTLPQVVANVVGGTLMEAHNTAHKGGDVSISTDGSSVVGNSFACPPSSQSEAEVDADGNILTDSADPLSTPIFIWRFHFTYRYATL